MRGAAGGGAAPPPRPLLGGACGLLDAAPPSAPPAAPARAPSVGAYFGATQTAAPTAAAAAATADPYAYGQRAYDAAPTGASAGHHRFSAAMATPNAAFISADGTTFSARRYGMALCERPLHPNTGVHVLEITIGSVDASDLVGGGFVGVAAPAVARCKFPPGLVRGSVAYTFDVQTLRQEEVKGTHVTSATKLPPGRGAVVGQLSTPGERGLESQTREQLHMIATDLPPFRVGDRLRMELDTATGRLAWLLNGKLITTINGVPGGYHFAVGSHMSPTFEATIDVQVPSVKQGASAPAGASASTAQQFFDGRSQAAAVQAQATSGVGKDGETAPYAQAPHVSLQQQLNPPQPPGYAQQPAYSSSAWQKPPAVPPLGQQGYPQAQAQVHGYPQQQPAPAAAQHPYNATRDGVPVAKAVAVVQPPMAEVAWYPYFDSRREATVKLLGQTENSAGARHFAGGVIEIRLGAISLSPHARASLPPRLSVQGGALRQACEAARAPRRRATGRPPGDGDGRRGVHSSGFALRAVHLRDRGGRAAEAARRLTALRDPSGQSERAGARARRRPRRSRAAAAAHRARVGRSRGDVDRPRRRAPPAPRAPTSRIRPPTTPSARSCFPSSRRASARPSRLALTLLQVAKVGARTLGEPAARSDARTRRRLVAPDVRARRAPGVGGVVAPGVAAAVGAVARRFAARRLHRRRHADGLGLGHLVRAHDCDLGVRSCQVAGASAEWRTRDGRVVRREGGEPRLPGARRPDLPGRPDVRRRGDEHGGGARAAEARAERAAADDAPVCRACRPAKLRPRRAVQELHATHRVTGNHIKDRPLWMEWRERQLAPETPKVGEMVVVLEVRNHYNYTKIAKKEDGSADGGAAADLFASLDNSATSGGEGANATAAGALDLTTTEETTKDAEVEIHLRLSGAGEHRANGDYYPVFHGPARREMRGMNFYALQQNDLSWKPAPIFWRNALYPGAIVWREPHHTGSEWALSIDGELSYSEGGMGDESPDAIGFARCDGVGASHALLMREAKAKGWLPPKRWLFFDAKTAKELPEVNAFAWTGFGFNNADGAPVFPRDGGALNPDAEAWAAKLAADPAAFVAGNVEGAAYAEELKVWELDIEVGGAESGKAACASVSLPPEFPDGLAMVLVECDGYDPLLIPVLKMGDAPPERAERRMFLYPEFDGLGCVLTWNRWPKDLDLHCLSSEGKEVNYSTKTSGDAKDGKGGEMSLDVDKQTGYGPETITLTAKQRALIQVLRAQLLRRREDLRRRRRPRRARALGGDAHAQKGADEVDAPLRRPEGPSEGARGAQGRRRQGAPRPRRAAVYWTPFTVHFDGAGEFLVENHAEMGETAATPGGTLSAYPPAPPNAALNGQAIPQDQSQLIKSDQHERFKFAREYFQAVANCEVKSAQAEQGRAAAAAELRADRRPAARGGGAARHRPGGGGRRDRLGRDRRDRAAPRDPSDQAAAAVGARQRRARRQRLAARVEGEVRLRRLVELERASCACVPPVADGEGERAGARERERAERASLAGAPREEEGGGREEGEEGHGAAPPGWKKVGCGRRGASTRCTSARAARRLCLATSGRRGGVTSRAAAPRCPRRSRKRRSRATTASSRRSTTTSPTRSTSSSCLRACDAQGVRLLVSPRRAATGLGSRHAWESAWYERRWDQFKAAEKNRRAIARRASRSR